MSANMFMLIVCLLCGLSEAQTSTGAPACQDVDTPSCIGFHAAKPDLCADPTFSQNMCRHFCGNCPLQCYSCPSPVRHPADCNTTATCGPNSVCVNRHLRAKDGHHEYLMSCESQELCSLLSGGFGKRDMRDLRLLPDDVDRYERDVILNCCHGDLCNFEIETTTTTTTTPQPTTTTTTTTTTPRTTPTTTVAPSLCKKDIVFVMQNHLSHTAHSTTTTGSPSSWIPFVEQLVGQLNVGPDDSHVAALTFDFHTVIQWYLNKYDTNDDVRKAIDNLKSYHVRHSSFFGLFGSSSDVLHDISGRVLNGSHGDRADAENVVVVLEYGAFNSKRAQVSHSDVAQLHAASHNVILISVGADPDSHHFGLATDSQHEIRVSSTHSLSQLVPRVVSMICPLLKHPGGDLLG